jgi:hypothetical protein
MAPQGRGYASLNHYAHRNMDGMHGARSAPPYPLGELDGVLEARGICSGVPAGGESKPALVKMWSPLWGAPLWSSVRPPIPSVSLTVC